MGASEILEILKDGKELTCLEISHKTDYSIVSVKKTIKRLLKDVSVEIEFRMLTQEEKEEKYGHKLGCRVRVYSLNK